jgi:hypothetical protein
MLTTELSECLASRTNKNQRTKERKILRQGVDVGMKNIDLMVLCIQTERDIQAQLWQVRTRVARFFLDALYQNGDKYKKNTTNYQMAVGK